MEGGLGRWRRSPRLIDPWRDDAELIAAAAASVVAVSSGAEAISPTPPATAPGPSISAAPWWATPIVAGIFLVIGSTLALGSTWLSDRRKLRRDDLRQWDREIRDGDIRVSRVAKIVRQTRDMRWGQPEELGRPSTDYESHVTCPAARRQVATAHLGMASPLKPLR